VGDEDLAVADLAGLRGADDGLDHLVDEIAAHRHLDARLRHEVDHVLGAAVELGVTALAAEALDLGHRHAGDADVGERGAHVVELEGLDDRGDEFHGWLSCWGGPARDAHPILQFSCHGGNAPARRRCTRRGAPPAPSRGAPRTGAPRAGARWRRSDRLFFAAMYQQIVIAGAGQAAVQAIDTLRRRGYGGRLTGGGAEAWLPHPRPPAPQKSPRA